MPKAQVTENKEQRRSDEQSQSARTRQHIRMAGGHDQITDKEESTEKPQTAAKSPNALAKPLVGQPQMEEGCTVIGKDKDKDQTAQNAIRAEQADEITLIDHVFTDGQAGH